MYLNVYRINNKTKTTFIRENHLTGLYVFVLKIITADTLYRNF